MSGRLHRLALALYPRAWRRRYGQELEDLCDECAERGEAGRFRLGAGVLVAALRERSQALTSSRPRRVLTAAVAVLALLAAVIVPTRGLGTFGGGAARKPLSLPARARATHRGPSASSATFSVICSVTAIGATFYRVVIPAGSVPAAVGSQAVVRQGAAGVVSPVIIALSNSPKGRFGGQLACSPKPSG